MHDTGTRGSHESRKGIGKAAGDGIMVYQYSDKSKFIIKLFAV